MSSWTCACLPEPIDHPAGRSPPFPSIREGRGFCSAAQSALRALEGELLAGLTAFVLHTSRAPAFLAPPQPLVAKSCRPLAPRPKPPPASLVFASIALILALNFRSPSKNLSEKRLCLDRQIPRPKHDTKKRHCFQLGPKWPPKERLPAFRNQIQPPCSTPFGCSPRPTDWARPTPGIAARNCQRFLALAPPPPAMPMPGCCRRPRRSLWSRSTRLLRHARREAPNATLRGAMFSRSKRRQAPPTRGPSRGRCPARALRRPNHAPIVAPSAQSKVRFLFAAPSPLSPILWPFQRGSISISWPTRRFPEPKSIPPNAPGHPNAKYWL